MSRAPAAAREALKARWDQLVDARPAIRIRAAAAELGVSELELLTTELGRGVIRLTLDFPRFLPGIESLGRVMALTRNDGCVLETEGTYSGIRIFDHAAQVVAPGVDLRIFPRHWVHAYAVEKEGRLGMSRSLQAFDRDGSAVHKVFLTTDSHVPAWRAMVDAFRHPEPDGDPVLEPLPAPTPERPDGEVDRDGLLEAWAALEDTHDFFRLLSHFGASRTQALRLAEGRFTRRVRADAGKRALEAAAAEEVPVMVFVGNPGTIQIHTGPVNRLLEVKDWFNVMDPGLSLHLDQRRVASAWVVEKPTEQGPVTSVELYDGAGDSVALLFGVRKPGGDGGAAWQALAGELA